MQYCVDHPEEISKLAKVKAQVSEVKGVMMENIEKVIAAADSVAVLDVVWELNLKRDKMHSQLLQVASMDYKIEWYFRYIACCFLLLVTFVFGQVLDRGEKIELLVDKTENLRSQVSPLHLIGEWNSEYCILVKQFPYQTWF